MELTHTARVRVPLERAWAVAGDPTLLASALPGAELEATDGLACHGTLTVKIGPITARYGGTVALTWRDDHAHRMVLDVVGDEIDGVGRAEATINATLRSEGAGATVVGLVSTLTMTGRAGQFGQALLADVGQGLLTDLVAALEQGVLADDLVLDEMADLHLEWDRPDEPADHSSEPAEDEEEDSAGGVAAGDAA
ncbi:MAG TPA: SRPBCC domain-containing protein, partial [Acidimicrobiales bacterium]|nr:SRPBCC domain-containing protein [Acidimicrobiales bacterium]